MSKFLADTTAIKFLVIFGPKKEIYTLERSLVSPDISGSHPQRVKSASRSRKSFKNKLLFCIHSTYNIYIILVLAGFCNNLKLLRNRSSDVVDISQYVSVKLEDNIRPH
jgi:hypothetical protein